MTEKLKVKLGPLEEHHAFQLVTNSPVNFLGRYLLYQLGCNVKCSPKGVFIEIPEDKEELVTEMLQRKQGLIMYWWKLTDPEMTVKLQAEFGALANEVE